MLRRIAFALTALFPLFASATDYQAIDSVNRRSSTVLNMTGIPVDGTTDQPLVWVAIGADTLDPCERYGLLMLTHPGRFIFSVDTNKNCTIKPRTP
jgi:hypothetical protein